MAQETTNLEVQGRPRTAEDELGLVKISDLARMSGVPTATIKHYMRSGLLAGPKKRTSRNMAYYDVRLAARVRAIKELQKRLFLPLKVIANLLEPAPSSQLRADLGPGERRQLGIADPASDLGEVRIAGVQRTRDEILAEWRITEADLSALERAGLARPTTAGAPSEARYTGSDLAILELLHEAREIGLGELFPIEVLEAYAEGMGDLVRREIAVMTERVRAGAKLPEIGLDELARLATSLSARLLLAMRKKLVIRELNAALRADQPAE